jgi:hypothetical protein
MTKDQIFPLDFKVYEYYANPVKYFNFKESYDIGKEAIKLDSESLILKYIEDDGYYIIRKDLEWMELVNKIEKMERNRMINQRNLPDFSVGILMYEALEKAAEEYVKNLK